MAASSSYSAQGKGQSRPAHVFPLRTGEHAALSILFTLYFTKPFKKAPHVFPCGGQVGVAHYSFQGELNDRARK